MSVFIYILNISCPYNKLSKCFSYTPKKKKLLIVPPPLAINFLSNKQKTKPLNKDLPQQHTLPPFSPTTYFRYDCNEKKNNKKKENQFSLMPLSLCPLHSAMSHHRINGKSLFIFCLLSPFSSLGVVNVVQLRGWFDRVGWVMSQSPMKGHTKGIRFILGVGSYFCGNLFIGGKWIGVF